MNTDNGKSVCPECGGGDSSPINTHRSLRECNVCGHPRESSPGEIRTDLIALGYDPDGLALRLMSQVEAFAAAECHAVPVRFPLVWEDGGAQLRGYLDGDPKTTLFIIERSSEKPDRGTMSGGVIPDEEDGKGTNENALISWLQGVAAPMYLNEFRARLLKFK